MYLPIAQVVGSSVVGREVMGSSPTQVKAGLPWLAPTLGEIVNGSMGRPFHRSWFIHVMDALMGAMTSVFRGMIRPHGLQVLCGPGPGDTGIHDSDRKHVT